MTATHEMLLSILAIPVIFILIVTLIIKPIGWLFRFFRLRRQLRDSRAAIAQQDGSDVDAAKRVYNGLAQEYNAALRVFPGFLLRLFVPPKSLLAVPPEVLEDIANADGSVPVWPENKLRAWHNTGPRLSDLEQMRRRLRNSARLFLALGFGLPIVGGAAYWYFSGEAFNPAFPVLGFIASFMVFFGLYNKKTAGVKQQYDNGYKARVLTPLAAFLDKDIAYHPEGRVPFSLLEKSGLVPEFSLTGFAKKKSSAGDQLVREAGAWAFEAGVLKIVRGQSTEGVNAAGRKPRYETVFHGLIYRGLMGKPVPERVFVLRAEDATGKRNRSRRSEYQGCAEVQFGETEFSKAFAVYAESAVTAYQALPAPVREALLAWRRRTPWPFKLALKGAELFALFPHSNELFNGPRRESLDDFASLRERAAFLHCLNSLPMQVGLHGAIPATAYPQPGKPAG